MRSTSLPSIEGRLDVARLLDTAQACHRASLSRRLASTALNASTTCCRCYGSRWDRGKYCQLVDAGTLTPMVCELWPIHAPILPPPASRTNAHPAPDGGTPAHRGDRQGNGFRHPIAFCLLSVGDRAVHLTLPVARENLLGCLGIRDLAPRASVLGRSIAHRPAVVGTSTPLTSCGMIGCFSLDASQIRMTSLRRTEQVACAATPPETLSAAYVKGLGVQKTPIDTGDRSGFSVCG